MTLLCICGYERVLCARGALNPVVAPCEDMLPYIPILIHHLWNVRKCVVSRGLEHQWSFIQPECVFVFFSRVCVCVCVCVWWEGDVRAHDHVCVFVWQDNRWKARSLSFSSGTCAVSITHRDPPIRSGLRELLEKFLPCPNGWQSGEDWQTTAVTHYSNHRTLKKGRGREGSNVELSLRAKVHSCRLDLEGNRAMSPTVRPSSL